MTVDEDKGAGTYVEDGHDVEHVTAIFKNPYRTAGGGANCSWVLMNIFLALRIIYGRGL